MTFDSFPGKVTAFDALLSKDRGWFDAQLRPDRQPAVSSAESSGPIAAPTPVAPRPTATPATPPPSSGPAVEASEPVHFLNARFGNDWSYEVVSRQRSGDEMVVLCKVTLGKDGTARSQFGKAGVLKPGVPRVLAGSQDGVPFTMLLDQGLPPGANAEDAAFRRAVIDALSKCTETL